VKTVPDAIVVPIFMFVISIISPFTLQVEGVRFIRQVTAPLVKVDGVVSYAIVPGGYGAVDVKE